MASLKSMRNPATADRALLLPEASFSSKLHRGVLSAAPPAACSWAVCTAAAALQQPAEAHIITAGRVRACWSPGHTTPVIKLDKLLPPADFQGTR